MIFCQSLFIKIVIEVNVDCKRYSTMKQHFISARSEAVCPASSDLVICSN
jgi:hypothetical protein